ncbi:MAG: metallophosphoesterase [Armatimonadota bacterium]|nr:metallophosphoesterase [Armatimonadota bacterium]
MRIVALADLHLTADTRPRMEAVAETACRAEADVLVVAGDCAADGWRSLGEALGLFADFPGPRLMVPGNHDLWEDEAPFDTWRVYQERVPAIAAEQGFHCLDHEPLVLEGTGFVGCIGWYDYAMRQRTTPREGLTVTPISVAPGEDEGPSFSAVPGAEEGGWEGLEAEDYAANGLIWKTDGPPQVAVWNDALHLDWERPDGEMAEHFADLVREQIAAAADSASRLVAVTHFVPFAELAETPSDTPSRAFAHAYLGSPLLGEALEEAEDVALVIYGHRHRQEVRTVRGIVTADASVARAEEGPLLLTLPD